MVMQRSYLPVGTAYVRQSVPTGSYLGEGPQERMVTPAGRFGSLQPRTDPADRAHWPGRRCHGPWSPPGPAGSARGAVRRYRWIGVLLLGNRALCAVWGVVLMFILVVAQAQTVEDNAPDVYRHGNGTGTDTNKFLEVMCAPTACALGPSTPGRHTCAAAG